MNRQKWIRIGGATIGAVATILIINGFIDLVYNVHYPARSAYKVEGLIEPAFDLASAQREWPGGLNKPGEYTRLQGYMADIKHAFIPASTQASPVIATASVQIDLGTRLASADKAKGQRTAQVCVSCHSFDAGGPNRTGPDLWGIVGRAVASHGGYQYSSAMAARKGQWTYEGLDKYLTSPARAIPGNKMGFAGIRNAADRANVLAFLGSLGSSQIPLPKPETK